MLAKIKELLKRYREMVLYLVFGGLTTLVNIASYALFADGMGIHYLVSTVLAWVLSVLFAYVTNRIWVFQSKRTGVKGILLELGLFVGFRALSGVVDMAAMYAGVDLLHIDDLIMKILSNVIVVILNYIFSKLVIFRKK